MAFSCLATLSATSPRSELTAPDELRLHAALPRATGWPEEPRLQVAECTGRAAADELRLPFAEEPRLQGAERTTFTSVEPVDV